jgi:hypothetical protein
VSYKKQELLTLRELLSSPRVFWWGPCCSPFWFFVLSYYMCVFTFWVTISAYKRLYLQLFVRGVMSYLRCLCLFVYSGVQHVLCFFLFFFLRLVYPMFSVSLVCPFFISLRYSLTFIWYILLTAVKINKILLVHCNNKFYCKICHYLNNLLRPAQPTHNLKTK